MKSGMTRWKVVPLYKGWWCIFWRVLGSVQSLVPSARPMKLATVMGASFSKSLQVRRPMVVSTTAVGPVGTTGGLIWLVVLGASGSCWAAGVDWACASQENTLRARTTARVRSVMRCLTPRNRLSQTRGGRNAAGLNETPEEAADEFERASVDDVGGPMLEVIGGGSLVGRGGEAEGGDGNLIGAEKKEGAEGGSRAGGCLG